MVCIDNNFKTFSSGGTCSQIYYLLHVFFGMIFYAQFSTKSIYQVKKGIENHVRKGRSSFTRSPDLFRFSLPHKAIQRFPQLKIKKKKNKSFIFGIFFFILLLLLLLIYKYVLEIFKILFFTHLLSS